MSCCINCGSYAINQSQHGREFGVDTNLCDVCYWRKRAENKDELLEALRNMLLVFAKSHNETLWEVVNAIAAIAKATGETK